MLTFKTTAERLQEYDANTLQAELECANEVYKDHILDEMTRRLLLEQLLANRIDGYTCPVTGNYVSRAG